MTKLSKKIAKIFAQCRLDSYYHLGLGDIRLTMAQQEDIVDIVSEHTESEQKDLYPLNSAEDIWQTAHEMTKCEFKNWYEAHLKAIERAEKLNDNIDWR